MEELFMEQLNFQFAERPGYELVGFCKRFWHHRAKRYIYAKPGTSFPIWRKIAQ